MKDFDFKELLSKLEENGMPMLEQTAKTLINTVCDWAGDSIMKSENKYDDFILPVLPVVRKYALGFADKIAAAKLVDKPGNADETKDLKSNDGGQVASHVPELGTLPMA